MDRRFDEATLELLERTYVVEVEARLEPSRRKPVWVATFEGEVFVRSIRGEAARWYRDLRSSGGGVLSAAGRRIPFEAHPAGDEASVKHANRGYKRKYRDDAYFETIVRKDIWSTTLRLAPPAAPGAD